MSAPEPDRTVKYEYLVTYRSATNAIWRRQGRRIKQTREAADNCVAWAKSHGCDTRLQRRVVGQWEDSS